MSKETAWRVAMAPFAFFMVLVTVAVFCVLGLLIWFGDFIENHWKPSAWEKSIDAAMKWWFSFFFGWIEEKTK